MDAAEVHEAIGEVHESGAKRTALLIAVLAALLAFVDMSGSNADQDADKANVDAANLWAFFQAKTIRQTILDSNGEMLELELHDLSAVPRVAAEERLAKWRATSARYESEPSIGEGRKELAARAKAAEAERDRALAAGDLFDYGAAALQLAIVLASASVVVGVGLLVWAAGAVGLAGMSFAALGWFAPTLLPL